MGENGGKLRIYLVTGNGNSVLSNLIADSDESGIWIDGVGNMMGTAYAVLIMPLLRKARLRAPQP